MASSLPELWTRGVALNPAAPSDVLLRLLDPAAGTARRLLCEERDLPADVAGAVAAHPEAAVRRAFARNPHVDPARLRPLADDPSSLVRGSLAGGPRPRTRRVRPLPDDILESLLTARDSGGDGMLSANEIVQELIASRQIPHSFRRTWPAHENPVLRELSTGMWHWLGPGQRDVLLADPDPDVRAAARARTRESDPAAVEADLPGFNGHGRAWVFSTCALNRALVETGLTEGRQYSLAVNPHTPADVVARLARVDDPEVRERVAARADIGPALLAELAQDPDEAVRLRARVQPLPRTWAQCGAVDRVFGACAVGCTCPITEPFAEPDLDWYRACAVSPEPVLRRVAASLSLLPDDLVPRLAEDPDPEVRHRLACHHPLAPPALLLETFLARPVHRPHLLTLPRLPRTGLGHLLDHADPDVRALAAADPTLARPPVRLLADPEERVRRAAAAHPVFSGEALAALLDDPRTAEGAAANPSLPAARMHGLLDLGGLPGPGGLPGLSGLPGGSRPPSGPGRS
ncbi:hypothetical protein ACFVGY_32365 [Streptomyces sp. NPDC127106]|uniref:hypothetical protein n=1 Tax=Streptomyces sp. NPDC127106 TaxID=3345360 RepID=UPI0036341751